MPDDQDHPINQPPDGEIAPSEDAALRFVSQEVTLDRAEVIAALAEAALAKATELSRFGEPRLRNLTLDAIIGEGDVVDVTGVTATIEAPLDPAVLALLSTSMPPAEYAAASRTPDDQASD